MMGDNIVNANGSVMTSALYWFARGVGAASGKKPKIVGLGSTQFSAEYIAFR
jgi:hypothetical protein